MHPLEPLGAEAVVHRRHVRDLHATILRRMGFNHNLLTYFYGDALFTARGSARDRHGCAVFAEGQSKYFSKRRQFFLGSQFVLRELLTGPAVPDSHLPPIVAQVSDRGCERTVVRTHCQRRDAMSAQVDLGADRHVGVGIIKSHARFKPFTRRPDHDLATWRVRLQWLLRHSFSTRFMTKDNRRFVGCLDSITTPCGGR
jgi:hypothetical protein